MYIILSDRRELTIMNFILTSKFTVLSVLTLIDISSITVGGTDDEQEHV